MCISVCQCLISPLRALPFPAQSAHLTPWGSFSAIKLVEFQCMHGSVVTYSILDKKSAYGRKSTDMLLSTNWSILRCHQKTWADQTWRWEASTSQFFILEALEGHVLQKLGNLDRWQACSVWVSEVDQGGDYFFSLQVWFYQHYISLCQGDSCQISMVHLVSTSIWDNSYSQFDRADIAELIWVLS